MEVVFLLGAVQAIFLATLIFFKKEINLADKILAVWFLFMGLHLFSYYIDTTINVSNYPLVEAFYVGFPMLEGAFTFVYTTIVTSKIQKLKKKYLLHLSHYAIFTIILLLVVFTNELPPKEMVFKLKNEPNLLISLLGFFNVFLGPVYILLSLKKLKKHRINIGQYFSFTEEIDLKWLKYVLSITIFIWLIVVITNILAEYSQIIDSRLGNDIIYTSLTLVVFIQGFFGIKQQIIYSIPSTESNQTYQIKKDETTDIIEEKQEKKPLKQYQKSGLKKTDSQNYLEELLLYMEEKKPYLDGKLSLKQIALALDISTNHLSQVINENLEKNFFDFVNEYRVDLVKEKMAVSSNRKYTLLALAYDCGFNSKSSFNAIFKKKTGLTPSQYLKSL
jgi:AraC-like DNA-binding protein